MECNDRSLGLARRAMHAGYMVASHLIELRRLSAGSKQFHLAPILIQGCYCSELDCCLPDSIQDE